MGILHWFEKAAFRVTQWIGSPGSIIFHTVAFVAIFLMYFIRVPFEDILLILTTAVSLEAIYLAIFIQMTVNRTTQSLEEVEEDIEDIQEDAQEDDTQDKAIKTSLETIDQRIARLQQDLEFLRKKIL